MKTTFSSFLLIALGSTLFFSQTLTSQAAGYLKLGDIKGESTDADHKDWIDVLSVDWGIHKPGGGATGATRRRAVLRDFVVQKRLDKSSPLLAEALVTNETISEVVFAFTRDGEKAPYLQYELKNVLVTSYSVSGGTEGNVVPTEQLSLNFEEIKVTYTERSGGKVAATWKVEEGESIATPEPVVLQEAAAVSPTRN